MVRWTDLPEYEHDHMVHLGKDCVTLEPTPWVTGPPLADRRVAIGAFVADIPLSPDHPSENDGLVITRPIVGMGCPVTRQITSTRGFKSRPRFTPDGREVFYLDRGRVQITNVESGSTRGLSLTAEIESDFEATKEEAFRLNEKLVQYEMLKVGIETSKEFYDTLVKKTKEHAVSGQAPQPRQRIGIRQLAH